MLSIALTSLVLLSLNPKIVIITNFGSKDIVLFLNFQI